MMDWAAGCVISSSNPFIVLYLPIERICLFMDILAWLVVITVISALFVIVFFDV